MNKTTGFLYNAKDNIAKEGFSVAVYRRIRDLREDHDLTQSAGPSAALLFLLRNGAAYDAAGNSARTGPVLWREHRLSAGINRRSNAASAAPERGGKMKRKYKYAGEPFFVS